MSICQGVVVALGLFVPQFREQFGTTVLATSTASEGNSRAGGLRRSAHRRARRFRHHRQLPAVMANIGDLVSDDRVVLGIHPQARPAPAYQFDQRIAW
jgi:hypothetical protein